MLANTLGSTMAKHAKPKDNKKPPASTVKVTPASHTLILTAKALVKAKSTEELFEMPEVRRFFEGLIVRGYKATEADFLPPK